jgi:GNAT superfamily N-acetyltransferase
VFLPAEVNSGWTLVIRLRSDKDVRVMDVAEPCVVRTARPDDLLAVVGVLAQREPDGRAPNSASDVEKQTWLEMVRADALTVYLAEVDGRAVGTATLITIPNLTYGCAPTAFVETVVVAHTYRRLGVASAIMRRILSEARAAGCNKVQVLSHKRHATDGAHRLYASLGFEPEAEGFRIYLQEVPAAVRAARAQEPG